MSETSQTIGFIGGGRVTRILAGGWKQAGVVPGDVLVTEPDDAAFAKLSSVWPEVRRVPLEDAAAAGIVFVALHPPVLGPGLATLRPCLSAKAIVISLAPKIPLSAMATALGTTRVARMIPNAPSLIGRGYNPVTFGTGVDSDARAALAPLFTPWGEWPEVEERTLEAYAILTGMGPTYFWYQWQALRDLASQFGLSTESADDALRHMIGGATETLLASGLPPADVMDLIPVRPLESIQPTVDDAYRTALPALFSKIRPAV
jgi:pyrroline-5-carboxylate reductase